jgi:predicted enzyme related to lactoylglutathione lyase
MAPASGGFVWYELITTDTHAARRFYASVAGWGTHPGPVEGMDYTLFMLGESAVAGLMPRPEAMCAAGMPPCWSGVIGVADVDATAARVVRHGGAVHMAPFDVPSVGRIATVADPQGARFSLFTPQGGPPPEAGGECMPGQMGWHELRTTDWQAAFDFYAALFGWRKDHAVDMGPMGTYQTFAAGGPAIGGMFDAPGNGIGPHWLYYIRVAGIDAAQARVTAAGGNVTNGPMPVPNGDFVLHATDKQGVAFALVGPRG